MGLMSMTSRRIKKLVSWILAVFVLVLLVAGGIYLGTVLLG